MRRRDKVRGSAKRERWKREFSPHSWFPSSSRPVSVSPPPADHVVLQTAVYTTQHTQSNSPHFLKHTHYNIYTYPPLNRKHKTLITTWHPTFKVTLTPHALQPTVLGKDFYYSPEPCFLGLRPPLPFPSSFAVSRTVPRSECTTF